MKRIIVITIGNFVVHAESIRINEEGDLIYKEINESTESVIDPCYIDSITIEQEENKLGLRYINDKVGYVDEDEEYY